MQGISHKLLQELKQALLDCGPIASDTALRSLFLDERLYPWRNSLPSADSPQRRVDALLDHLHNRKNADNEKAIVLLLHVLAELTHEKDQCRGRLLELATRLGEHRPEATDERSESRSTQDVNVDGEGNIVVSAGRDIKIGGDNSA